MNLPNQASAFQTPTVSPYPGQDCLFEGLADAIGKKPGGLQPLRLVVPSVHFRDWLQVRAARRFGICMGLEFSTPQEFVVEVFRAAGIERAADWAKRRLEWAILEKASGNPALLPLVPGDASVRDRFAVARAVADRFDQYAHFRPEMLEAWSKGEKFCNAASDAEKWQRELWHSLYESMERDAGLTPSRLHAPGVSGKLLAAFPSIIAIGSGSLDPLLMEILGILAQAGSETSIHVVLPCLGYLADIRKRNSNDSLPLPGAFSDPEGFELGEGVQNNPLLASMARHAVGTFVLIGEHGDQYGGWPEPRDLLAEPDPDASPTLLQRIQHGVRANNPYTAVDGLAADGSLRIHECYGPRRELEALHGELLRAYAELPGLEPGQILIAAPSLEEYAPLVAAVFHTKENPLPVRLTEVPASEGDEVLEGLLALLAMARGGRGRASEVLDLLQLRAVREALGAGGDESKTEFLADKLRESGITQGIADSPEPGSWEFAGDRLVAGMFFGPEEPAPGAAGGFHLPVADSMGSNFPESEAFLEWFAALRATLKGWQTPATPRAWSGRLRTAAGELLKGEDGRMEAASGILKFLAEVETPVPVDVGVAFDWMSSEAAGGNRRAPASGATPFGRLKQLHNTPCRVLALVGMQNDNFPSRATSPSWDLLRARPKIWDRNARVDDRQMFLDSVLAPTARLIITASTLNIRTNKKQPLSTCVDELLAAASTLGAERRDLVLGHPLQPFSRKYFERAGSLPKPLGQAAAQLAETIHSAKKNKSPLWSGGDGLPPSVPDGIAAESLVAFWKDPAKGFLKAQGIAIPFEGDDDGALDRSVLFPDPLGLWKIKDAMMHCRIEAPGNMGFLKAKLRADRVLPPGSLGEKVWETAKSVVEPVAAQVAGAKGGHLGLEASVEVRGRVHKVTGSVLLDTGGGAVIAYRAGKIDDAGDFLGPWIMAVLAGAAGHQWPTLVFDETTGATPGQRNAIPQPEALERLRALVEGYLQGQCRPLCYAPLASDKLIAGEKQAVAEWTKDDERSGGGEGRKETSRLAWRDRDPFEKMDGWNAWKDAVAQPLKAWGGF